MGVLTDWTLVPSRAWRTGTTSRPRPRRHTPRRSSPSPSRPPQRNVDPQKRHLRMARTQHRSFFGFLDSLGVMMNVFIFSWFTKDFFSRFPPLLFYLSSSRSRLTNPFAHRLRLFSIDPVALHFRRVDSSCLPGDRFLPGLFFLYFLLPLHSVQSSQLFYFNSWTPSLPFFHPLLFLRCFRQIERMGIDPYVMASICFLFFLLLVDAIGGVGWD